VLFGGPNNVVNNNVITSSANNTGLGGINLVDGSYVFSNSYANMSITNNKIIGSKLFKIGIAIGSNVWGMFLTFFVRRVLRNE